MAESPSQVFARRMRRYRERRGWTQKALAGELADIGWKVDRAQLARIESGDRGIALDEAIMIAWALALPPALVYLPLGEASDVAIAPDVVIHPDLARKWVTGREPAAASDRFARMPREWKADMTTWWIHDRLSNATKAVRDAEAALRAAEYVKEPGRIIEARAGHVNALKALIDVLEDMRSDGLLPPEIHENTVEAMRVAGFDYDGPTYPGAGKENEK